MEIGLNTANESLDVVNYHSLRLGGSETERKLRPAAASL
jgi:hypothetical protein